MNKSDLIYARDAVSASLYCKEWWRLLTKNLKIQKLTADDKIKVFFKIAEGLISESFDLRKSTEYVDFNQMIDDFINYINSTFMEISCNA